MMTRSGWRHGWRQGVGMGGGSNNRVRKVEVGWGGRRPDQGRKSAVHRKGGGCHCENANNNNETAGRNTH